MRARYEEARAYHLRSFDAVGSDREQRGMAVALNNVGATYQSVGDYVSAADVLPAQPRRPRAARRPPPQRHRDRQSRPHRTDARRLPPKGWTCRSSALEIRTALGGSRGHRPEPDLAVRELPAAGQLHARRSAALRKSLDLYTAIGVVHSDRRNAEQHRRRLRGAGQLRAGGRATCASRWRSTTQRSAAPR